MVAVLIMAVAAETSTDMVPPTVMRNKRRAVFKRAAALPLAKCLERALLGSLLRINTKMLGLLLGPVTDRNSTLACPLPLFRHLFLGCGRDRRGAQLSRDLPASAFS
jgi:hypothetical protein